MRTVHAGKLILGVLLMASFLAVLVLMFAPVINGQNAFNYLDGLYNSISKGSADYSEDVRRLIEEHPERAVSVDLTLPDPALASEAARLLESSGAVVAADGAKLHADLELDRTLQSCLIDAGDLYANRGERIDERYGLDGRVALYAWWRSLRAMERELTRQKLFADAELVRTVNVRTVEPAYNYHGIGAQRIGDRWLLVLASLAFYVLYTVWYGYSVMFLFEGLGMQIGHAEAAAPRPRRKFSLRPGRLVPRDGG